MNNNSDMVRREVSESTVLDVEKHRAIINDLEHLCARANVPIWAVCRPMKDVCSSAEIEWVRGFNQHVFDRDGGLVLSGVCADIELRMAAIAGAFIRNYIDAQVYTTRKIVRAIETQEAPNPTVLLIPDFFIRKEDGGHLAEWQISPMLSLLMERHSLGRLTVLYVQSLGALRRDWGSALHRHIENYYSVIGVGE